MATALLALGLVCVAEGLVWALAPRMLDDLADLMRRLPVETRRVIGLGALALGVALVWAARGLGA